MRAVIAAALVVHILVAQESRQEPKPGSICLAPVKDDGDPRGYVSKKFAVRVDDGAWVAVPEERPTLIPQLSLESRHLVRIRDGEKQIESFRFAFSEFDSPELCLWYKPWYQTWSISTAAGQGRGCRCQAASR